MLKNDDAQPATAKKRKVGSPKAVAAKKIITKKPKTAATPKANAILEALKGISEAKGDEGESEDSDDV